MLNVYRLSTQCEETHSRPLCQQLNAPRPPFSGVCRIIPVYLARSGVEQSPIFHLVLQYPYRTYHIPLSSPDTRSTPSALSACQRISFFRSEELHTVDKRAAGTPQGQLGALTLHLPTLRVRAYG